MMPTMEQFMAQSWPDERPIWRIRERRNNCCPGGCYIFDREPAHTSGKYHVPVDMFWGRVPWKVFGA